MIISLELVMLVYILFVILGIVNLGDKKYSNSYPCNFRITIAVLYILTIGLILAAADLLLRDGLSYGVS